MNEVTTQTAALLLDAIEQRGLDTPALWEGLPISRDRLRLRDGRIDWGVWVALIDRIDRVCAMPLEQLFVPGAGTRAAHPFVQVARGLLSLADLYALFARWGARRSITTLRARFERLDGPSARFTVGIDPTHTGSLPTLRFIVGLLASLPTLQGYSPAQVRMQPGATPHYAEYALVLPGERPLLARAGRFLRSIGGAGAALDELEAQANEIASKNTVLEKQLAEIKDRERWLDVALSAGDIGLWRWDPAVRRVRLSSTLAAWLGVPGQTDVDTQVWGRLVHPEDQAAISKLMADALTYREAFETDYRIVDTTGNIRWFHIKGHVETESDGHVYAYGTTVDITEQKQIDSRLRLADRLIAAGTLAAGVAHEINNPLTYVLGSIDLLKRRLAQHPAAREAVSDLIEQALDGVERIRAVVADVRAFARHDDETVGPVDLGAVCTAAIRIVSSDVRHRAIMVPELAPDTPLVLANDSRLGQVMINLIVNASQAMPPDRSTTDNRIVVRTRCLPDGHAVAEVEDNGIGIPPDVLPRVFDPFFTTKPVGLGTGLGLSVVQGIVTSLGGRIDVDSTVGRGTTFRVTLRAAAVREPVAAEPSVSIPRATYAPARILVIDDEPMVRSVVARTLASQGFDVDEASDGRDGLTRALASPPYDAIVCDMMMPDLDGVALHAEVLRARPELAPRIVFISGGAVTPRTQAFLEQPGMTVLHKPFTFEVLIETIERVAQGTSTTLPLT